MSKTRVEPCEGAVLPGGMVAGEVRSADDWQPIETAPRDGRPLLLSGYGEYGVGEWARDDWAVACVFIMDDAQPEFSFHPTHWRLLPEGPR